MPTKSAESARGMVWNEPRWKDRATGMEYFVGSGSAHFLASNLSLRLTGKVSGSHDGSVETQLRTLVDGRCDPSGPIRELGGERRTARKISISIGAIEESHLSDVVIKDCLNPKDASDTTAHKYATAINNKLAGRKPTAELTFYPANPESNPTDRWFLTLRVPSSLLNPLIASIRRGASDISVNVDFVNLFQEMLDPWEPLNHERFIAPTGLMDSEAAIGFVGGIGWTESRPELTRLQETGSAIARILPWLIAAWIALEFYRSTR